MKGEEMRKVTVLFLALILTAAAATGTSAQSQKGNYWLSVPLCVVVPTGDMADFSSTGWGIGFGVGYWINDCWLIDAQLSYHNFQEKEISEGLKVNGATAPIELGVAYYFMKNSRYRPYATFRVGYMNYQGDFRDEWSLGEKNSPSNSIGIGMAFMRGENGEVMLFIEPNVYAAYADETFYYWTVNFGITWNIGG
jgi:opacity protein-like surface antigen